MKHIFTLKFNDKYSVELVNNLYKQYKKYIKDFKFYCYTDNSNGLHKDIVHIPLVQNDIVKIHWRKIDFFKNNFVEYSEGDECIIMDIDQIIVSNPKKMIERKVADGGISSYDRWWGNGNPPINGGWYKFNANTMQYVYDKFYEKPEYWQNYYFDNLIVHEKWFGEQNFVYETISENNEVDLMPGQWVSKYNANDISKNLKRNMDYQELFGEPLRLGGEWASELIIVHFCEVGNNPSDFTFQDL